MDNGKKYMEYVVPSESRNYLYKSPLAGHRSILCQPTKGRTACYYTTLQLHGMPICCQSM